MKKNNLAILILFITASSFNVQPGKIVSIVFSTATRGSYQTVTITKDSIVIEKREVGDARERRLIRKLKLKEWGDIQKTLSDALLNEMPTLKSPTKNRVSDGAMHSGITINVEGGESYSHLFDDENPHEKLKPLLRCILAIAKN